MQYRAKLESCTTRTQDKHHRQPRHGRECQQHHFDRIRRRDNRHHLRHWDGHHRHHHPLDHPYLQPPKGTIIMIKTIIRITSASSIFHHDRPYMLLLLINTAHGHHKLRARLSRLREPSKVGFNFCFAPVIDSEIAPASSRSRLGVEPCAQGTEPEPSFQI